MCKRMHSRARLYTHTWWLHVRLVGGEDGDGRVFDWKARCLCGRACEWPLPGRGQLHPALSVSARFLYSEMLVVAPSSRLGALRPPLQRGAE